MNKKIDRVFTRPAQPGMVGDGFRVYHYFPGGMLTQRRISPFLMLDFNAEYDFGKSEKIRGVDVHPHKGFETVTIAYQGAVEHHDSAGNHGIIYPGDVQWMTAGAGILHKEYHEREFARRGGPFEMVQLWVNLPAKNKSVAPHYQELKAEKMGKFNLENDGGTVNVIAGNFNGVAGPAETYSPVHLFDIRMNAGGNLSTSIDASYNTAILVVKGTVSINGTPAPEHSLVLHGHEGTDISITAEKDSILLLMSGEPIEEPIASYGPFVMNTQQEIYEAIEDFQAGKFGHLD
ncbi:pirin family protein [Flavihumibacter stibioxidans]|uniref:Short-chain dehydrogenase n=1 Tax=Flavihumibacter stibioxidans TaxID=1834163 RepID=A0ABR7MB87_9BACT|nr:pirin family protein [Flavihumibacter stibioxidans]MBC6491828.1 short-chain dehydrogenase [Flavihumibacter stibioxidans]